MSKIEWTERTWNPIVGCSKVSAGCENCYAMRMAWRLMHNPKMKDRYEGVVKKTEGGKVNWTGKINMVPDVLHLPLEVKKPTTWFVNSMSDLFHEGVPFEYIDQVFVVMQQCPQHIFQILTKRTGRATEYFAWKRWCNGYSFKEWPLANVWMGTSIENQKAAKERMFEFICLDAAVRFLSCEPLVGKVTLSHAWIPEDLKKELHWVIVGGESGPNARPMHPDWARSLRDECNELGIPFFFKQWGEYAPHEYIDNNGDDIVHMTPTEKDVIVINRNGNNEFIAGMVNMKKVGKKKSGRMLDGREWNEMPSHSGITNKACTELAEVNKK